MKQSVSERKTHIDKAEKISVKTQCSLLQISRSSHYYLRVPESDFNLKLMEMIDREFLEHPWKGVPRMVQWLNKDCGLSVNKKRVERLYRLMGISASAPGPNTS
ncbi:IS3 family transposase, partial [Haoranjiania flava]